MVGDISRRSIPKLSFQVKSASKVANWIIVDSQVSLLTLSYHWQTLSNSLLLLFSFSEIWS